MKSVITPSGTITLQTLTSFWNAPFKSCRFRKEIEETTRYAQRLITTPIENIDAAMSQRCSTQLDNDEYNVDSDVEFWELGDASCQAKRVSHANAQADDDEVQNNIFCSG